MKQADKSPWPAMAHAARYPDLRQFIGALGFGPRLARLVSRRCRGLRLGRDVFGLALAIGLVWARRPSPAHCRPPSARYGCREARAVFAGLF